ncbi:MULTISPECIES: HEPN domain-containing protein [Dehalobacter]|jgi:Uncharacterized conserved protein related to C-terminal domain of eukaryotic chaperone, SACSIN|uniref:HEPN domain-containing protein n=1 Tax=Dehalobacter TaxID=56112 RepID=UPI00028B7991|nr:MULTISPECIES: HEPN domain-containing protein [unclassified Dehalobacter]AFV02295.1 HEPN domain protein [Dehalobacter sp. DCA]AFV05338.1 HEPN domain protein [Dehalobacter sp. CF]EQB22118.1 HEPN domain protein [Dehalobacter sp. UNSWDHB]MDJ0305612.1 HEPN domain-containing protein [Dehalobacter sp.]
MEISSLCRRWLEFAADDLTAAKHLLSLYPFRLEIICYHCEQSAEKMLKAFLLMHDEEAPRIHDLGELCRLCALKDKGFDGIAEDCSRLTPFGVRVRYPEEIEVTEADMHKAIKSAEHIMDFITHAMTEEQHEAQEQGMTME